MSPTLRILINDAIEIIEEEREIAQYSYCDSEGVVHDLDERAELQKLDAWLERARKALETQA